VTKKPVIQIKAASPVQEPTSAKGVNGNKQQAKKEVRSAKPVQKPEMPI
jgi:hypothetical protein